MTGPKITPVVAGKHAFSWSQTQSGHAKCKHCGLETKTGQGKRGGAVRLFRTHDGWVHAAPVCITRPEPAPLPKKSTRSPHRFVWSISCNGTAKCSLCGLRAKHVKGPKGGAKMVYGQPGDWHPEQGPCTAPAEK